MLNKQMSYQFHETTYCSYGNIMNYYSTVGIIQAMQIPIFFNNNCPSMMWWVPRTSRSANIECSHIGAKDYCKILLLYHLSRNNVCNCHLMVRILLMLHFMNDKFPLLFGKHNPKCKMDMGETLTHLPLEKMATISKMIFSDAVSWMKSFVFLLNFHWSLFIRVQLTQHWFI